MRRPRSFIALLGFAALALAGSLALVGLAVAAPPAAPTPTPVPAATIGQQLFVAKGCITCHRHDAVAVQRRITIDSIHRLDRLPQRPDLPADLAEGIRRR